MKYLVKWSGDYHEWKEIVPEFPWPLAWQCVKCNLKYCGTKELSPGLKMFDGRSNTCDQRVVENVMKS